jgi:dipeptidase
MINILIMRRTFFTAVLMFAAFYSMACTNFLVTKGASTDGSTMITYAADSHVLYGELYYTPAADHPDGAMLDIHEWDTGKYLGQIEQVSHTYSVVGNMNEHQLAIGETTFGGREELKSQSGAIMDYGSLIYVTLQRAKTAREAIEVMTGLVEKYGYYSSGESFSIAGPEEVWILEMIGKGEGYKGAVWVARKIPDGYISGHANQARITTFPLNDSENCIYSKDVISFAHEKGWFDGLNKDFSFSDVYAPVDFGGARFCEARVWAGFNKVASNMEKHIDYAMGDIKLGEHGFASNRMPLWIKPDKKLSVQDVMGMMRDHFEGTPMDMTTDIGAGPHGLPYRWRPLTWEVDSVQYCNERAISTQQTGFSFVSQSRSDLPSPIGGILWFGVDDTYSTCYVPVYCGITEVPEEFAVGNGDLLTYSETSAFWTFNLVTNFTYLRYNLMIEDVVEVQHELENKFVNMVPAIDAAALTLWENGDKDAARDFLTTYVGNTTENTVDRWKELGQYLLIKYKDGNIMKEKGGEFLRTEEGLPASPDQPGYPEEWYRSIVKQAGEKLKVRE